MHTNPDSIYNRMLDSPMFFVLKYKIKMLFLSKTCYSQFYILRLVSYCLISFSTRRLMCSFTRWRLIRMHPDTDQILICIFTLLIEISISISTGVYGKKTRVSCSRDYFKRHCVVRCTYKCMGWRYRLRSLQYIVIFGRFLIKNNHIFSC